MMCVIYNECLSFITQSHIQQATTLSCPSGRLCGRQNDVAKMPHCWVRNPRGGRGQDAGAQPFLCSSQSLLGPWEKTSVSWEDSTWELEINHPRPLVGVAQWSISSASFLWTPPLGTNGNNGSGAASICAGQCQCRCCFPNQYVLLLNVLGQGQSCREGIWPCPQSRSRQMWMEIMLC